MRTIIILKNILTLLALVLGFNLYQSQLTSSENYIYTKTYFEPSAVSSTTAKGAQSVTYFDGLGRPKQTVGIKVTPDQNDLVMPIIYDPFGRQALDYLPVPVSSLDGGIQSTTGADVNTYHSDNRAYSEKIFENSPLDRVLEQFGSGDDWKSNKKRVTFEYLVNDDNDKVLKFITTTSWVDDITKSVLSLATGNYYTKASLYKNKVKDEDDNISYEFKNGQGQIILVRKMLTATEAADTYYVYNEYDQLAFVISPKAIEKIKPQLAAADLTENGEIIKELSYQYRYDGKQRLAEKKLPGKGWEFMVYDKQDRLVLSQDVNLTNGKNSFSGKGWLFTKYDKWGRIVYTGFFSNTATRKAMQTALNNMQANPYNNEERTSNVNFTLQGMPMYYTKNAFPTGSMTLLSVNYYDTYPVGTPVIPATVLGQTVLKEDAQNSNVSTKSLPTASYVKNVDDDNWTKNYILYDQKSRTISTTSLNHLGGYTKIESELDFSGVTKRRITSHKRLNADPERVITENFTYDLQNRLLTHTHQVDNNAPETLAQNEYNELSQLKSKKVGGSGTGNHLQTVDYRYNIRGWMTQINDPLNMGTDLFGYKINYNQVDGLPIPNTDYTDLVVNKKYNGNIAEVIWKTNDVSNDPLKTYGYVYDGLNRLRAGFYQAQGNEIAKEYLEKIDYDINGNIARLKRSEGVNSGNTALLVDNLRYDYTGNKLTKITDEQYNPSGYPTLTAHNNIDYDDNGNMINLKDKNLSDITYNYLNLTKRQNYGYAVYSYNYRADGVKVSRSSYYTFPKLTYDVIYLDGFQYSNNDVHSLELDIVPTAEGYYSFTENRYIYQYKDHLGNTRVSYVRNSAGVIEVTDKNEYYPFGMSHPVANSGGYLGIGSYKSYKYNGKELQENGMYDYGFRQYMPDIGRWSTPDPLMELASSWTPYRYAYDNPLRYIDPKGLFESRKEARAYRRAHNIDGSIKKQKDGSYVINDMDNYISYVKGDDSNLNSSDTHDNDGVVESILLKKMPYGGKDAFDLTTTDISVFENTAWKGMSTAQKSKFVWDAKKMIKATTGMKLPGNTSSWYRTKLPNGMKNIGRVGGAVSGAFIVMDVISNQQVKASNILDATVTTVSFVPGWGWVVGGVFFGADMITKGVTGQSIGDHLDNYVEEKLDRDNGALIDWNKK